MIDDIRPCGHANGKNGSEDNGADPLTDGNPHEQAGDTGFVAPALAAQHDNRVTSAKFVEISFEKQFKREKAA
ncbi:hypothetical protein [Ferrovibrio sp.]|uniref:hypothetical protein n=1 Tax=Ferrovibrio sp. TaxID=1917215 RepID=UPI0035B1461E